MRKIIAGLFITLDGVLEAQLMTSMPKLVVSATLDRPDWGPTTVIRGGVTAALARLKEQPGKDIVVGASGILVRFLLHARLLDELRLLVHPVIVGQGRARRFWKIVGDGEGDIRQVFGPEG